MKKIFDLLDVYLPKNNILRFTAIFIFITLVSIGTSYFLDAIFTGSVVEIRNINEEKNIFVLFLGLIVFAPFFETLIFHWIPVFCILTIK